MKFKYFVLWLPFIMAACSHDDQTGALDTVGTETSASWHELRKITGMEKDPPKPVLSQPRYCYKTMQDVICYPAPIPGQEYRLTGYQTANGKTGYVLPAHRHDPDENPVAPPSMSKLPVTNVPNPPKVAGVATPDKPQLKEVIFDPAELQPKTLVPDKEQ